MKIKIEDGKNTIRTLREIWAELLNIPLERVQPADSFFALGGTSVHIIDMQEKIEARLGLKIKAVSIFTHATLEELAAALEQKMGLEDEAVLLPEVNTAGMLYGGKTMALKRISHTLDDLLCAAVEQYAHRQTVDPSVCFFALFIYLLYEISEMQKFSVFQSDEMGRLKKVDIDLNEIDSVHELVQALSNSTEEINRTDFVEKMVRLDCETSVRALFFNEDKAPVSQAVLDCFDLTVSGSDHLQDARINFYLNAARFSQEFIDHIVQRYMNLLGIIVQ